MNFSTESEWQVMKSPPAVLRKGQWGLDREQLKA